MILNLPARQGRLLRGWPYDLAEGAAIVAVAAASVGLFWSLTMPLGPLGRWQVGSSSAAAIDASVLTRFDPFFRSAVAVAPTAVTSLALKLFGVRMDQSGGRGSAIIANPEGLQSSFAIGDEIVPGVRLKAVGFDNVTLDRGGVVEQLFLDQSTAAPVATSGAAAQSVAVPATAGGLANDVAFAPRVAGGAVTGLIVTPKGGGQAFAAAGLQPGDVVTQINGQVIRSSEDAVRAVSSAPGGRATIVVERGGQTLTLSTGTGQ